MRVDSVHPSAIYLADAPASVALAIPRSGYDDYKAGGPVIFIGRAESVVIKAD